MLIRFANLKTALILPDQRHRAVLFSRTARLLCFNSPTGNRSALVWAECFELDGTIDGNDGHTRLNAKVCVSDDITKSTFAQQSVQVTPFSASEKIRDPHLTPYY